MKTAPQIVDGVYVTNKQLTNPWHSKRDRQTTVNQAFIPAGTRFCVEYRLDQDDTMREKAIKLSVDPALLPLPRRIIHITFDGLNIPDRYEVYPHHLEKPYGKRSDGNFNGWLWAALSGNMEPAPKNLGNLLFWLKQHDMVNASDILKILLEDGKIHLADVVLAGAQYSNMMQSDDDTGTAMAAFNERHGF